MRFTHRGQHESPDSDRASLGATAIAVWLAAAVGLLVLLSSWQGDGYWEYSDGVYSMTARLLTEGHSLYTEVAGAQPPPIYLAGAAILSVSDTLGWLRAALAGVELITSALVLTAVWRLTASRGAAVVAALLCFLMPWTLREHAQLIPETFAAPLLLAAALCASRRRTIALGAALGALATGFKLAFGLPAIAVLVAVRSRQARWCGLGVYALAGLLLGLASLALFGDALLTGAVRAQRESGTAQLSYVGGLWAQGGWNLLPLLVAASIAWPMRHKIGDPDLQRTLVGGVIGALLVFMTLFKTGSYLTLIVVLEPFLLCLAAAAIVAAFRTASVPCCGLALLAAVCAGLQVGSLLVAPDNPRLFTRPLADSGAERTLSPQQVDDAVRAIRACPKTAAASGPPFLAFVAGRRVAGDQPDQFILSHARGLARFRAKADADQPRCP